MSVFYANLCVCVCIVFVCECDALCLLRQINTKGISDATETGSIWIMHPFKSVPHQKVRENWMKEKKDRTTRSGGERSEGSRKLREHPSHHFCCILSIGLQPSDTNLLPTTAGEKKEGRGGRTRDGGKLRQRSRNKKKFTRRRSGGERDSEKWEETGQRW